MIGFARPFLALALGLLIGLVVGLAASPVEADSRDADARDAQARDAQARSAEAKALFDAAMGHLERGDFTAARDLLHQSLALAANPATGFNLAIAYRGTGEVLRAVAVLDEVLAGRYGAIPPGKRAEVRGMLEATRKDVAHLALQVTGPATVELRVDGKVVPAGTPGAPLTVDVDPGERVVTAAALDHRTEEARVRVDRGATVPVALKLEPLPEAVTGKLVVETTDGDAVIVVPGVGRGQGRFERDLAPGAYQLRLESKAGTREVKVTVRARSTVRYRFEPMEEPTLWESPWLWGGVGLGVAAIAVGVIFLVGPTEEDPVRDPVYGVTEALR